MGTPHEGHRTPLNLSFYDPIPEGILPNDDLDLQLVWLHHLRATGARSVTPELLAEAWTRHVKFPYDEYGVCLRNQELGLRGEAVGGYDNWFGECMGAAIRSEIWACVAPGEPERAAGFAWCDAVCDHTGEGVWAEVFFAALESMAFVERDPDTLLDGALHLLPRDSRVRRAIEDTRSWWAEGRSAMDIRELIVNRYGEANFTDVKANLAFTVLGWLAGEGDFGKSLCIATNCGMDTDCTAATLGSLLGILDPDGIPEKWARPIGQDIVISDPIIGITAPANLEELTRWTLELREQLSGNRPPLRPIVRRAPATPGDGVLCIPARIAGECPSPNGAPEPARLDWVDVEWGGHWVELPAAAEAGTLVALSFELKASLDALAMAYAPEETRVWLDGHELATLPSDRTCIGSLAPSFHRGGRVVFDSGTIPSGLHELLIWVNRPSGEACELVFGLANRATKLWHLPRWHTPRAV